MAYLDYPGLQRFKGKLDTLFTAAKNEVELVAGESFVPLPWTKGGDGGLSYSNGTVLTSAAFAYTDYIDVSKSEYIIYSKVSTTNSTLTSGMAFYNANKEYISGVQGLKSSPNNNPVNSTVHVPANAKYARFTYRKDTETYGNFWVQGKGLLAVDTDAVKAIEKDGTFDYSIVDLTGYGISAGNGWTSSTVQKSYSFAIPKNVSKIKVTANANGSIIAFLDTYAPVTGETVDFSQNYHGRISMAANEVAEFNVTGDMHYMFALITTTGGTDNTPAVVLTCTSTELKAVDTESADETGKTDRGPEIYTLLNAFGECRLAKGVFYTGGNIVMPAGSSLTGAGSVSVLKLLAAASSVSTVLMGPSCTVKDLTVKGGDSTQWTNADEGSRNGIEWTGETQTAGTVDNCFICNFDDAGIYLHDTTQKTYRNLSIVSCYITGNYVGVDIRKDSEFNKISNCTIIGNKIGYRNRGGNNDIANSGLDANKTGILVDADAGTNNGHGTITGCSINHSNSNTGYGLIIRDTGRMLVSNCNIYFSKVLLDGTNGNVISNCGFGQAAGWEITDGECSLFIGCMVRGWDSENSLVTITNNTDAKIINCYDRNGTAYSA